MVALLDVLHERFVEYVRKRRRNGLITVADWHNIVIQYHVDWIALVAEGIGKGPGQYVVDRRAYASHVRHWFDVFEVGDLLAWDEVRRPRVVACECQSAQASLLEALCQAKIAELCDNIIPHEGEQDV